MSGLQQATVDADAVLVLDANDGVLKAVPAASARDGAGQQSGVGGGQQVAPPVESVVGDGQAVDDVRQERAVRPKPCLRPSAREFGMGADPGNRSASVSSRPGGSLARLGFFKFGHLVRAANRALHGRLHHLVHRPWRSGLRCTLSSTGRPDRRRNDVQPGACRPSGRASLAAEVHFPYATVRSRNRPAGRHRGTAPRTDPEGMSRSRRHATGRCCNSHRTRCPVGVTSSSGSIAHPSSRSSTAAPLLPVPKRGANSDTASGSPASVLDAWVP